MDIETQCLKQWVVFIVTLLVERHYPLLLKKTFNVDRKSERDEMPRQNIEEKVLTVVQMWKFEKCKLYMIERIFLMQTSIELGCVNRHSESNRFVWLSIV